MKIQNTGKVRLRVEGYGYVEPGGELTVPEAVGRELIKGSNFKTARAGNKKNGPGKGQTRRPAPTENDRDNEQAQEPAPADTENDTDNEQAQEPAPADTENDTNNKTENSHA